MVSLSLHTKMLSHIPEPFIYKFKYGEKGPDWVYIKFIDKYHQEASVSFHLRPFAYITVKFGP